MTENKRFHYDWKTGRFKDTLSNSCATSNMRVLETQINNACYNYEKKIKKLKKENKELQFQFNLLREQRNEFHRGARENANRVGQLERENKELKQQLSDIDKLINDLGSEEMCRQYDEIIGDFE